MQEKEEELKRVNDTLNKKTDRLETEKIRKSMNNSLLKFESLTKKIVTIESDVTEIHSKDK
jgi:hypothetical protein